MATTQDKPPKTTVCRHCFARVQLTSIKKNPTQPGKTVAHYNCSCGMVIKRTYLRYQSAGGYYVRSS